jgi:hypothetical protein
MSVDPVMSFRRLGLLAAPFILAGCLGSSEPTPPIKPATQGATPTSHKAKAVSQSKGTCPLTLPNGRTPPGEPDIGANHGNGKIWTAMWPHNVVIATPDYTERDGSVGMKWPWWWRDINGKIAITGRRLDAEAPPLTAYTQKGYRRFQPSAISFPTEGCWEVTGKVGSAKLTFVTLILKASRYWPVNESA